MDNEFPLQREQGKLVRGSLPLVKLPTGDDLTVKYVVASGVEPGPTILITANIHGDEVTGTIACHRFLESLELSKVKGTVVCFPSLNPTGLLAGTRFPTFDAQDPNRLWPNAKPSKKNDSTPVDWLGAYEKDDDDITSPQEDSWAK
eukprot:Colp12_sorted_trinity150504_noHs@14150